MVHVTLTRASKEGQLERSFWRTVSGKRCVAWFLHDADRAGSRRTGASQSGVIPLFRIGVSPVSTLDQTKADGGDSQLSLETLLKLSAQGQLEPDLATSWSQINPVTYVYHLRPGVKFWDGALTAPDVVYSLNYDRAPGSEAGYAFASVKSVAADGPSTVVVTLKQPDASWQYVPAEIASEIFEMKFAEDHKSSFGEPGTLIMGTGPWEVNSFDPTSGIQLSANPTWWGGKVPIQHISLDFFSSDTSLALAFRAGEIDLDPFVPDPQNFAATSGAKIITAPSCAGAVFSMNTQLAPWDDVHVRRAVAYALNRADIIAANGGYATPKYTLIPTEMLLSIASQPQVNALYGSLPLYQYDVAMAKHQNGRVGVPPRVQYNAAGVPVGQHDQH